MKILLLHLFFIISLYQTDYRDEFNYDYKWAVKFVKKNRKLIINKSSKYQADKAVIISVIFPTLFSNTQSICAEENYCNDQKSWEEWDELVKKYPADMDIQTLHALRLGLCVKVARGDITIQEATDIFENAREKVINRKKIEGLQEEKGI